MYTWECTIHIYELQKIADKGLNQNTHNFAHAVSLFIFCIGFIASLVDQNTQTLSLMPFFKAVSLNFFQLYSSLPFVCLYEKTVRRIDLVYLLKQKIHSQKLVNLHFKMMMQKSPKYGLIYVKKNSNEA